MDVFLDTICRMLLLNSSLAGKQVFRKEKQHGIAGRVGEREKGEADELEH